MTEWYDISHLLELSATEKILGLCTPLIVYIAFFVIQLILPGRRVPGYVINPETGKPRNYRLNGIWVFSVVLAIWWFELTGMPRDWFYRSSVFAVIGGTFFTAVFSFITFFSQPKEKRKKPIKAWWTGSAQEVSWFNERFDMKMYFYAAGGTILVLNVMSATWYHYERFGSNSNPGMFLYMAFFTFYILDYFVSERVTLYTYDMMHEGVGFKLFWGGLVIYGWLFPLPIWGMTVLPNPGFGAGWENFWLIGTGLIFLIGWAISRGSNLQKYTFKRWPERKFLGIKPEYIEAAGDRKILCSGFWGVARHVGYLGEGLIGIAFALSFGYFSNPWAWTYLIFIVSMFTQRQLSDDRHCAEKYGPEYWTQYQARVKYRICPGIY
ncbi:MAG: ergosterol biosynthesis protein [Bacteroidetes bacterium]|nr:ergosterol biosynthesis protein [Bacteroidota bacterium]MCY4204599.1 ergosterol biosynthesis protein [Bacteroidota bacterium]